tara:strand:+ start:197 stop:793 length:597 start_codon:yes stop_codon:yes gene_type:complete
MNVVKTTILGLMLSFSTIANAGLIYFDNQAEWEAAVLAASTETFDDAILLPGLTINSSAPSFSIGSGKMHDRLTPTGQSTVFSFDSSIQAFGGLWDLAGPGGVGLGILVTLSNGDILSQEISDSIAGGFWGFISTISFTSIDLATGSQGGNAETYEVDSIYYASSLASVAATIPEPSTIAIFGLALIGLASRRFKKQS